MADCCFDTVKTHFHIKYSGKVYYAFEQGHQIFMFFTCDKAEISKGTALTQQTRIRNAAVNQSVGLIDSD